LGTGCGYWYGLPQEKTLRWLFHKRKQLSPPRTSARLCRKTLHVTARRDLNGQYFRSKEKITLPGSAHTVTSIVSSALPLDLRGQLQEC